MLVKSNTKSVLSYLDVGLFRTFWLIFEDNFHSQNTFDLILSLVIFNTAGIRGGHYRVSVYSRERHK